MNGVSASRVGHGALRLFWDRHPPDPPAGAAAPGDSADEEIDDLVRAHIPRGEVLQLPPEQLAESGYPKFDSKSADLRAERGLDSYFPRGCAVGGVHLCEDLL
jgi:hypothetical protein